MIVTEITSQSSVATVIAELKNKDYYTTYFIQTTIALLVPKNGWDTKRIEDLRHNTSRSWSPDGLRTEAIVCPGLELIPLKFSRLYTQGAGQSNNHELGVRLWLFPFSSALIKISYPHFLCCHTQLSTFEGQFVFNAKWVSLEHLPGFVKLLTA